jgi:hypothetical protein
MTVASDSGAPRPTAINGTPMAPVIFMRSAIGSHKLVQDCPEVRLHRYMVDLPCYLG